MPDNILKTETQTNFEEIKHLENESEFWLARELMPLLGYKRWEDFHKLIQKTQKTDFEEENDHIRYTPKKVLLGSGATRQTTDYKLSRFACYKIAMLGNTKECIQARTYFAIQTRKQEIFEELSEDQKRLQIREEVTKHNKKLFKTAQDSGVTNFANFNDAGYLGLYGMRNKEIVKNKKLGKDNLLDRAGATELAANLFRITQTDEKLNSENINSQTQSEKTHFMVGGKIRQTIKDIGGTLPEKLTPQKHIKEVKKSVKKLTTKNPKTKKLT